MSRRKAQGTEALCLKSPRGRARKSGCTGRSWKEGKARLAFPCPLSFSTHLHCVWKSPHHLSASRAGLGLLSPSPWALSGGLRAGRQQEGRNRSSLDLRAGWYASPPGCWYAQSPLVSGSPETAKGKGLNIPGNQAALDPRQTQPCLALLI